MPTPNQQSSLAAFLAEKPRFDALLGVDPDTALWGAAGDLQQWNCLLAQVTDAHFRRGEFAD